MRKRRPLRDARDSFRGAPRSLPDAVAAE
jgi:hypothetical protein